MTAEELQQVMDSLQEKGYSPEQILDALKMAYEDGKLSKDELQSVADAIGADVGFNDDPTKAKEGATDKQIEASEEDPDGDPAPSDGKGDESSDSSEDDEGDEDEGEEDEKSKAFKLMGL